jgi:hypothetical protein
MLSAFPKVVPGSWFFGARIKNITTAVKHVFFRGLFGKSAGILRVFEEV